MSTSVSGEFGLGPIDQVGYVVANLDRVLPLYQALYGSFTVTEYPMEGVSCRDKTVDCRLKIAFNRSSPVEIEIIQPLEGETPYGEHLRRHGEGLHHVRFRVASLDAKVAQLRQAGFVDVFSKRFAPTLAFAYLEPPPALGGSLIELFESPE